MDDARLHPSMLPPSTLLADGREDRRPWLLVDLTQWPADMPLDPLPPVPLVGIGPIDHPFASRLDVMLEPGFALATLASRIESNPLASAALVQLLRATEGVNAAAALTMESMAYAMLQGGAEHARWQATQPAAAPAAPGKLHVARNDNRLDLLLDRPHALNAIDRGLRDALFDAFTLAVLDESIAAIRLRAIGRAFSVGADLGEFGTTRDPVEAHAIRARTLPAWPLLRRAGVFDVHVQGACVGSGLELAAFARRLTATSGAWFHLPETGMGILPGFGGTVSVPRRVGRQRAALLILSGKRIDARTALHWGLIDAIVDDPPADQG
jgi:enoyl-CoA hydratase/carnithine racemase